MFIEKPKSILELIDPVLLQEEIEDPRYNTSPFRNLKKMLPKQKGSRFEAIASQILERSGYCVERPTNTDHDRRINGCKVEIKGSTLIRDANKFSFLQLRPSQDYEEVYFVMFYPFEVIIMSMNASQIKSYCENGTFGKQHGGSSAESGTYCFYGNEQDLMRLGAKLVIR